VIIGGCFQPYVTGAQTVVENTVEGKGPVSLYKKFRYEWWNKTKNAIYKITPLILANTVLIPVGYNVAFGSLVFLTSKIIFSLAGRKKKNYDAQPYSAGNPAYSTVPAYNGSS
jgi:hypothetical protein